MSSDSMGNGLPTEDFTISFMKSQTEYFHRFMRFKNIDPDRQVLLENAVEQYLVELEKDGDNVQKSAFSLFKQKNFTERVIYNTLQEDTTVPNPIGKISLTLLMIVERKQIQRPGTGFGNQNNIQFNASELNNNQTMFERGEMTNVRENQSQFSNPLTGNNSEFAIMPLEEG